MKISNNCYRSSLPFVQFNNHVKKTFDYLPQTGKIAEVTKRILICVIAPFAYLVLGLVALAGFIFSKCYNVRKTMPHAHLDKLGKDAAESILTQMKEVQHVKNIHSAHVIVTVQCDEKTVVKEIIRPIKEMTAQTMRTAYLEAYESFQDVDEFQDLHITWNAFFSGPQKKCYHFAHGSQISIYKEGKRTSNGERGINYNLSPEEYRQALVLS